MLERETKLLMDGSSDLPPMESALEGVEPATPVRLRVEARYFDTADLRLARWGATLRHRDLDGWMLKVPLPAEEAGLLTRDEIPVKGDASDIPAEAVGLVDSLTRGAPLAQVAVVVTDRTSRLWRGPDGAASFELTDDRVEVTTDAGTAAFREIEVELFPGSDRSVVEPLLELLEGAGAMPTEPVPKVIRGLGASASAPADVEVPQLDDRPSSHGIVRVAIASSVRQLLLRLPAARAGIDPEGVHQARVATRRLRSDLRTFRPLLDGTWVDALRADLEWLADALGRVRDADVLLIRLRHDAEQLPGSDPRAIARVVALLEAERAGRHTALVHLLDRDRVGDLYDRLVSATHDLPTTGKDRDAQHLAKVVRRPWRRLVDEIDALPAEPTTDHLHRVRLLTKRARYAAEAATPAFGDDALRFAGALEAVQDELGEVTDAGVMAEWLAAVAPNLDAAAAFMAGRLAEHRLSEAEQHRHGWERPYRKAMKPRNRRWIG